MLWITLVFGLVVGWWVDHPRQVEQRELAERSHQLARKFAALRAYEVNRLNAALKAAGWEVNREGQMVPVQPLGSAIYRTD